MMEDDPFAPLIEASKTWPRQHHLESLEMLDDARRLTDAPGDACCPLCNRPLTFFQSAGRPNLFATVCGHCDLACNSVFAGPILDLYGNLEENLLLYCYHILRDLPGYLQERAQAAKMPLGGLLMIEPPFQEQRNANDL